MPHKHSKNELRLKVLTQLSVYERIREEINVPSETLDREIAVLKKFLGKTD